MSGRIGVIVSAPETKKAKHGDDNVLVLTVRFSDGGTATVQWMPGAGDDTSPRLNDIVAVERFGGILAVTASKTPGDPALKPGEREIYSRDPDGKKAARIKLNNAGRIDIESLMGGSIITLAPDGGVEIRAGGKIKIYSEGCFINDTLEVK
jgi:hypothetical protein